MFAIFPEILQQTEKGDIEAVACLVRKYFGDQQVFLPNLRVAELCANAEITIQSEARQVAARLEAWDAKGQFRIVISIHPDIRSVREQNYMLAHMLGHVFLDLQPKMAKGELQRSIFEKKLSPMQALLLQPGTLTKTDEFACSLLLPKGMVKKAMSTLSSRKDAAAFFNVEVPLLEFRLKQLGMLGGTKETVVPPPAARNQTAKSETPRAAATKPKAETPSESPSRQDLSSLARVNRSVAARSYKTEEQRTETQPPASKSSGMERLRQLARKIDKTVDE